METNRHIPLGRLVVGLEVSTVSIEVSIMLIVLGVMFVFAGLRQADIIVKRVVTLYIWCITSLAAWFATTFLYSHQTHRIIQDAGLSLIAVTIIGTGIWLRPLLIRMTNEQIDRWVFQVPDFNFAIQQLWQQMLELASADDVYRACEVALRNTLSLAAVRIMAVSEVPALEGAPLSVIGPNPYFIPKDSSLRFLLSPPAVVLLPLNHEGIADHWIALSHGVIRPPLTAVELSFASRVAAEIQTRVSAISAEERRLEKLRRESAFREEIADAELRALRAQINPHFLFNSLNTIADLSVVNPVKAEEMTLRLSSVFRYVLANTERQFTSVGEELDFARRYLDIEEARFEDRLKVQFDVEPAVLQERIPALLLQPLIENALKHGIGPRMQGGTLDIWPQHWRCDRHDNRS